MCVILIKRSGVEMPSRRELHDAFIHNPHGCGVVSSNGVYWRGMGFRSLMKHLKDIRTEDSCIIHFRFATHGSHKPENCHPFYGDGVYFAHNGVLPIPSKNDMTDSEIAFRETLLPAIKEYGLGSDEFAYLVSQTIYTSKFAFMQDGRIFIFGRWIREANGLMWSNLNHRSYYHHGFFDKPRTVFF